MPVFKSTTQILNEVLDSVNHLLGVAADVTIPPVTVDTTGLATDAKQDAQTALLTDIKANQTNGSSHIIVDEMPPVTVDTTSLATSAKQDTGNTSLGSIDTKLSSTNTKLDTIHTDLGTIDGHVDGLETLVASTNTKLDTLHGDVDGLETLIGSTNTKLDTLHGDVDGLETLIGSTNTKLDTVHSDLGSIDGHVDGIETLIGSTNTKLDTLHTDLGIIDGHVDGIEALIASTNTKLDTLHADFGTVESKQDTGNASIASVDVKLVADTAYAAKTLTGTDSLELTVSGYSFVLAHIGIGDSGPTAGDVNFTGTLNGTNYLAVPGCSINNLDGQIPTFAATEGFFAIPVGGLTKFKLSGIGLSTAVAMRAVKSASVMWQLMSYTYVKQADSPLPVSISGQPIEVVTS